jgi:2,3-bisphosphoglycerate-independent phosphoglycerate mutase
VDRAISTGQLFASPGWEQLVARARSGGTFHFIGLLSDGGVHSDIDHLFDLLAECARLDLASIRVHVLLDGRDVPDRTALRYVDALEELLSQLEAGNQHRDYRIASGGGRMAITMDRYGTDWEAVARVWRAHVHGDAAPFATARAAIENARLNDPDMSDQYLSAFAVVNERGDPIGPIRDGDSVMLFNFRGDRAIALCRAFDDHEMVEFDRGRPPDVLFAGITQYDNEANIPRLYLVPPPFYAPPFLHANARAPHRGLHARHGSTVARNRSAR